MDDKGSLKPDTNYAGEAQLERGELPAERSRSRSISPGARDYRRRYGRSRSPAYRDADAPDRERYSRSRSKERHGSRKSKGGFKWKDKASNGDGEDRRKGGLERGYRELERRDRDKYRDRSRDRGRDRDFDRDRRSGHDEGRDGYRRDRDERDRPRREDDRDQDRSRTSRDLRNERRDVKEEAGREKRDEGRDAGKSKDAKKEKKEKKQVVQSSQTMIVVYINDRLGTKAGIPCLPSDPIKLFKAQVAARIGREPHEIMLKRQGERPFKDQLTLEDYGVSNGVQLDLELDTGE